MKHGLRALRDCLPNDVELGTKNVSIAIVGKDRDFTIYEDDACNQFLGLIAGEERTRGGGVRDRGAEEAEEQMEQA